jgi:hypothetical protein
MWTSRFTTGRCRVFCSTTKAIAATGIPTKKHQRQPTESTSRPPTSGPLTVAMAKVAPM